MRLRRSTGRKVSRQLATSHRQGASRVVGPGDVVEPADGDVSSHPDWVRLAAQRSARRRVDNIGSAVVVFFATFVVAVPVLVLATLWTGWFSLGAVWVPLALSAALVAAGGWWYWRSKGERGRGHP